HEPITAIFHLCPPRQAAIPRTLGKCVKFRLTASDTRLEAKHDIERTVITYRLPRAFEWLSSDCRIEFLNRTTTVAKEDVMICRLKGGVPEITLRIGLVLLVCGFVAAQ